MTEVDGSSSIKEKSMEEETTEAGNLMSQGKRNLVCGEVPTAVNQFQDACRLFAKHYGEMGKECAESYYYYGHALLDLARMETGVLGNALQGVPEEEEEEPTKEKEVVTTEQFEDGNELKGEERDKVRLEVVDAMAAKEEAKDGGDEKEDQEDEGEKTGDSIATETEATNGTTDDEKAGENKTDAEELKEEKEPVKSGDADSSDKTDGGILAKEDPTEKGDEKSDDGKKDEEMDTETGEPSKAEAEEGEENEGDEESQEDEGEEDANVEEDDNVEEETEEGKECEENADDVPHLQLAWEMLELAKVIYLKEDMKLKAAESFLKLGEVSLETENYEQSANDFNECLKLQKEVLKADDRLIAETYYQLGLAYSFNKEHDLSVENFQCAIKVIEEKIEKLTKFTEENETGKGKEPGKADDPVVVAHQEIKELKDILPDIMTKIEDAEEDKKNMEQMKHIAKETLGASSTAEGITFSSSSSSATETTDVKVHNISHLIRKKRKPDEEDEAEENDAKKCRQEDGSGDAMKPNEADSTMPPPNGADRMKRAPNGADSTKQTPNEDHPIPNGDNVPSNGVGHDEAEKENAEIKVKTVEDVKNLSEEKMDDSTSDTAAS